MPDKFTALIVGCGNIAGGYDERGTYPDAILTHAGAYKSHGGFQITACIEPDEERRKTFMKTWDVEYGFPDFNTCAASGLAPKATTNGASNWFKAVKPRPKNMGDWTHSNGPQTQCAQCGYPGCRPYAEAIAADQAPINLCPPGGDDTIRHLAGLLGKDVVALAEESAFLSAVAVIDESLCIGCTHCRSACPVDAIVGAHQLMHTIIASECTGCELCIEPCPVDCISMRSRT